MAPLTRPARLALVAQQQRVESAARQQQLVVMAQLALAVLVAHQLCQLLLPGSSPRVARAGEANNLAQPQRGLMVVLHPL